MEQVCHLLQLEMIQIHVLGLSESKFSYFHPDSGIRSNGFKMTFKRDHQKCWGEVLVYVKDGVCCKRRTDLKKAIPECI